MYVAVRLYVQCVAELRPGRGLGSTSQRRVYFRPRSSGLPSNIIRLCRAKHSLAATLTPVKILRASAFSKHVSHSPFDAVRTDKNKRHPTRESKEGCMCGSGVVSLHTRRTAHKLTIQPLAVYAWMLNSSCCSSPMWNAAWVR